MRFAAAVWNFCKIRAQHMERLPCFLGNCTNEIHGASQFIENRLDAALSFSHNPSWKIESPEPQEFQQRFVVHHDAAFAEFLFETAIPVAGMFLENFMEYRLKVLISACQRTFMLLGVEGALGQLEQFEATIESILPRVTPYERRLLRYGEA